MYFSKFINDLQYHGKKKKIESSLYKSFYDLKVITKKPMFLFFEVIELIKPVIYLKIIKKAKIYYQIPRIISISWQKKIALKWLIKEIRDTKQGSLSLRVNNELIRAGVLNKSNLLKKKERLYATAIYNRSFLHFKW